VRARDEGAGGGRLLVRVQADAAAAEYVAAVAQPMYLETVAENLRLACTRGAGSDRTT